METVVQSGVVLSPVLKVWMLTAVVLFLKMYATSAVQGIAKIKNRSFDWPEDRAFFGKNAAEGVAPLVLERARGVWRNDLENIPVFLLVSLGAALGGAPFYRFCGFMLLFVLARILHTVFFLLPRQPHRNLAYQLSTLATVIMAAEIVILLLP